MGDENKIDLEDANITIGNYYDDLITVTGADANYQDWLNDYISNINIDEAGWTYEPKLGANDITLTGAGEEMLRVAKDGFYVRGVRVEADEKEAQAVYEAFKQWMTYAILNGELNKE